MALFGIKRIQYCKATQLAFSGQNNPFLGIASEPTNTFTDVVCMINSRATLTIEQAVVNKQIVYTAKLQFVTPADPMLDVDHYAFIATTNDGERILLGANTRPQVAVVTAQGVFGNAGELTAYTTTAEFKANYRPLRLPVTAAEPISGPAYDICCGQIPQPQPADNREFTIKGGAIAPENEPADDRTFDICCGKIALPSVPDTRIFEICCGEIVGEEEQPLTVVWLDYANNVVDRKTYEPGEPEPTTQLQPDYVPAEGLEFGFRSWELVGHYGNTTIYKGTYRDLGAGPKFYPGHREATGLRNKYQSTTEREEFVIGSPFDFVPHFCLLIHPDLTWTWQDNIYFRFTDTFTEVDWYSLFERRIAAAGVTDHINYIYNENNVKIGYYLDNWQGEI